MKFCFPRWNRIAIPVIACFAVGFSATRPGFAAVPLSYVFQSLDRTNLLGPTTYATENGYVVGYDNNKALVWDLSTGAWSALDSSGLAESIATGITNGYAVGFGATNHVDGKTKIYAWNLATGQRTTLDNTNLDFAKTWGAGSGYAAGYARDTTVGLDSLPFAWNVATGARTALDFSNLDIATPYTAGSGYVVGTGSGAATGFGSTGLAWNLSTGQRTVLNYSGLDGAWAYGATNGYAVGNGFGSATGGSTTNAFAWNLSTGQRIRLNKTGLGETDALGAGSGFAVGVAEEGGQPINAYAWDIATNTKYNLQRLFLPTATTLSFAYNADSTNGTIIGTYDAPGISSGLYALVPFTSESPADVKVGQIATTNGNFTQTGGTAAINGQYRFVGGDTYTLSGGTLQGTGTLTGDLVNVGGILNPGNSPGTFHINGDFIQGDGGTLNEEILSLTTFDKLSINGTATLSGTLLINALTGYTPNVGDTFDILTATQGITGEFTSVPEYWRFQTTDGGTIGQLVFTGAVVPEAGSGILVLLGSAGTVFTLLLSRRRYSGTTAPN